MKSENAIVADKLTKEFGDFTAVDQVSFTIPKGEIFGLLGPNGAGKTTTIRMLCGLLRPSTGDAKVMGYQITSQPEKIKTKIGYMSQQFSLYNDLTAYENLDFYARLYGLSNKHRETRIGELIEMAGLENHRRSLTSNLSGAWRQRLALACAIVHNPPMLFLDEPTAGVDPISRREFWKLIYGLAGQGVSVLATTHYMDEAEYCNNIGMMYRSKLITLDDPDTLKESYQDILVEIDCESPGKALLLINEMSGVLEAALYGALLHVTIEKQVLTKRIQRKLESEGIVVNRIEEILPSLEDVFVNMIKSERRALVRAKFNIGGELI
ncbi:multidrug ABC transporter ATP-binding protein [candidate division KSB1 bacterium 4484_219]|nr:MAG: multidrug ABC transporter ATP-binding protein [candidate division KSB1 bacterium 4484_219]